MTALNSGEIRPIAAGGWELSSQACAHTHIMGVGAGSWVEEKGKSDFKIYLLNHC